MEQMPLQGKTVIVTRPQHQAEQFSLLLRERGAGVLFFPTIEIVPIERWDEVDEAIEHNRSYDAMIFTSSNAVRYFFDRARARGIGPETLMHKTIYALGSRTAEAASFYGIGAVRFPGAANARELASALIAEGLKHRRYLMPKGRLAGSLIAEALRARGKEVDEVIVYDTVLPHGGAEPHDEVEKADVVTFFSPSSVENFFFLLPDCTLRDAVVAAIGETTAGALRAMKIRVDIVPARPNVEDFAAAIENFFRDR
jgi:uroporphyrinogen III methyltransferase / synthase